MSTYHKINGLYKRYREGERKGRFIFGQYSVPEFEYLINNEWEWSEKLDGTNVRILFHTHPLCCNVEFKGRTDRADMPKHLLAKLQETFPLTKLKTVFDITDESGEEAPDIALFGEGVGYKIQQGCKYFGGKQEVGFVLFDVRIGKWWLKREDVNKIAEQLGIKAVPIVGHGTIKEATEFVKKGFKSTFGDFIAEGLVIRPTIELKTRSGQRIITKIKHKDFNYEA